MSRNVYWDRVLVVDNEIPESILDKAYRTLVKKDSLEEGKVNGDLRPQETVYQFYHDKNCEVQFLLDYLHTLGVLPVLKGHTAFNTIKRHRMGPGGKMSWHTDGTHSLAVSIYFTDPVGGELQVLEEEQGSQSVLIAPKKNRFVVMKCSSPHRVLEVLEGERESVQIFIDYLKDNEDA